MSDSAFLLSICTLDPASANPLYVQLCEGLRQSILQGQLKPGTRLPSSRDLAELLSVSRNTVVNACQQLIDEGYLEAREKSGTFISTQLPEHLLNAESELLFLSRGKREQEHISNSGKRIAQAVVGQTRKGNKENIFTHGVPALDMFPFDIWARLTADQYRNAPLALFHETHSPAGYWPLREAVAGYLRSARSVRCRSEQVIIVSGSQQAFYIAAVSLLDPGDKVWMEEPGCMGPRAAFQSQGAQLIPIPMDHDGIDIEYGIAAAADARVIYVNPSHQYPLGTTLSLSRRIALLKWVANHNVWVIEDDFDSEFRYTGRPLPSLQGLGDSNRIIYIGTFSKTLFPSLRMGYMVVPETLLPAFTAAKNLLDKQTNIVNQAVLSNFIHQGYFNRHIRRMRTVYQQRNKICVESLHHELDDLLTFGPTEAGMHITAILPKEMSDIEVVRIGAEQGIELLPLSEFYVGEKRQNGLILGYTGIREELIPEGVRQLKRVLISRL